MKFLITLSLAIAGHLAFSAAPQAAPQAAPTCPKIDPLKKYPDGVHYCPSSVQETDAWSVMRCAYDQAKTWHAATDAEQGTMRDLVQGLKDAKADVVLSKSDALGLVVCRVATEGNSYLVMYTKPGIRDYSGPFLMFREGGKDSGVVIHSPHDGQDNTHSSTKLAFQDSNALAMISNGHPRAISGKAPSGAGYSSDWAHHREDLGYAAFAAFKNKFPESVHLHIHGMAKSQALVTDSVGWTGAQHTLRTAFIDAMNKALVNRPGFVVSEWRFNGWTTGIAMTQNETGPGRAANQRWVGSEISVKLHSSTAWLGRVVRNLEADYLKKPRP